MPSAAQDLVTRLAWRTALNARKSLAWAWLDVKCQYRRTRIGPTWETINLVVMLLGLAFVSALLLTLLLPVFGSKSLVINLSKVDLPAPFAPINAITSPDFNSSETSSKIFLEPY